MKLYLLLFIILAVLTVSLGNASLQIGEQPLYPGHMIEPAELAHILQDTVAPHPLIYNIGPRDDIPTASEIGPVSKPEFLDTLRKKLSKLSRKSEIVIYCGCCPYKYCPNLKPAVELLKEMKFTSYKVLDLPRNIKSDWIDKGYPVEQ
jgi:hypothetical protein